MGVCPCTHVEVRVHQFSGVGSLLPPLGEFHEQNSHCQGYMESLYHCEQLSGPINVLWKKKTMNQSCDILLKIHKSKTFKTSPRQSSSQTRHLQSQRAEQTSYPLPFSYLCSYMN